MGEPGAEIKFEVEGWPPVKNEAKSLLAADSSQAQRVLALLEAARTAVERTGWSLAAGKVALELVIRCPGQPVGDATNFLGGVGDVLQDKTSPWKPDHAHLHELRAVALYADDRQISQISYREEPADTPSYSVRIRVLG
jgi:hypothetical protein